MAVWSSPVYMQFAQFCCQGMYRLDSAHCQLPSLFVVIARQPDMGPDTGSGIVTQLCHHFSFWEPVCAGATLCARVCHSCSVRACSKVAYGREYIMDECVVGKR